MIPNSAAFRSALLHRLDACPKLAGNPETCTYLPEILLRTTRDAVRLLLGKYPSASAPELCASLGIDLEGSLKEMLLQWENALRTPQKYAELSPQPGPALQYMQILKARLEI